MCVVCLCCWKPGKLISGEHVRTPCWLHLTHSLHAVSVLWCYQWVSATDTAVEHSPSSLAWLRFSSWPWLIHILSGVTSIVWYSRVHLLPPSFCVLIPVFSHPGWSTSPVNWTRLNANRLQNVHSTLRGWNTMAMPQRLTLRWGTWRLWCTCM